MKKNKNSTPQKTRRSHRDSHDEGLYLSSWSALEEYLKAQPQSIRLVRYAARELKRLQELLGRYPSLSVPCQVDDDAQEGLRVTVILRQTDEDGLLEAAATGGRDLIVACDHITDTRNLGAIARTAAFFGVRHLLLPKDRQAPITTATLGAAQGAFAQVQPVFVTNLGRTLLQLKERGYWIFAADMDGAPLDQIKPDYEKAVLVLGSEEKGIGPNILSKSDVKIAIPSPSGQLESLNVSVAAGILIHGLYARATAFQNKLRG